MKFKMVNENTEDFGFDVEGEDGNNNDPEIDKNPLKKLGKLL